VLSTSVLALLTTSSVAQSPIPSIEDFFPNNLDTSNISNYNSDLYYSKLTYSYKESY
jgi:hypothetical protein